MLDKLTHEDFVPLLGTHFELKLEGSDSISLDLVQLKELTEHVRPPGTGDRVPFSVVFRGPLEVQLPQRMYDVAHSDLGTLSVFFVPIGETPEGYLYEAVFN